MVDVRAPGGATGGIRVGVHVKQAQGTVLAGQGAQGAQGEGMVAPEEEAAAPVQGPGSHGGLHGLQGLGQGKGQGRYVPAVQPPQGRGGSQSGKAFPEPVGHGVGADAHGGRSQGPGAQAGAWPVDDAGVAGHAQHHARGGLGVDAEGQTQEGREPRAEALHEDFS